MKNDSSLTKVFTAGILAGAIAGAAAGYFVYSQMSHKVEEIAEKAVEGAIAGSPKTILDSINAYMQEQQAAEQRKGDELVIAHKDELSKVDGLPVLGNATGDVDLVYFYDLNCPYCKRMDPVLEKLIKNNDDLRVVHRDIPILAQSSRNAAIVEGIIWEEFSEKYPDIHDLLIGHEGQLNSDAIASYVLDTLGSEEGARILSMASDMDNETTKEVVRKIERNLALARSAGITGTPFVYVPQGDGIVRGAGQNAYEDVMALIHAARESN